MEKVRLPYLEEIFLNKETPPNQFDEIYNFTIKQKKYYEGYITLETAEKSFYLFISEGYPYAAGTYEATGYKSVQIRDFFSSYLQTRPHIISFYRTDEVLTKSMIVLFQHLPTMQITTDLVDVEEILGKIKQKGVDSILAIKDLNETSIVLCQQGIPANVYLVDAGEAVKEESATDKMLVYIYSRSGQRNVTIDVFQDIIISKAPDSCPPPENYPKSIPDFFTRQQPDLHVMLGTQSITKYRIKGRPVRVGRVPENDIVINNLGVSRRHAEIIEENGKYYIQDLGSVNGTYVNGQKVEKDLLNDKDEILIGKHKIIFQHPQIAAMSEMKAQIQESQTVMMDPEAVKKMRETMASAPAKIVLPDGQSIQIVKPKTVIGNGPVADIKLNDKSIAPEQVQILKDSNGYKLVHLSNVAATIVNGKMINDSCQLTDDSSIQIGRTNLFFRLG